MQQSQDTEGRIFMSKIANAFKGGNGKAFIPFITCGDPSLEVTEQLVYAMEEAGANLIELGIPFSDPTAEGPVIQAANTRALSGGVTTDKIFAMVEKIRKNTQIPMVFMTYANVVFSYGTERFIKKASQASGVQLASASIDWKESPASYAAKHRMQAVSLVGMDGYAPARYAQANDMVENIDSQSVDAAADFVVELLKNI